MKTAITEMLLVTSCDFGAALQDATPPYQRMDYGPALFWTYQVAPGNIAQKGMAIRLDDGPGGVSKETRAGVTKTLGQAETSAAPYSGYAIEP